MKNFYLFLILCFTATISVAQVPHYMSYQAVLRNQSDQLLTNQDVGLQISIIKGSVQGNSVYVETQTTTTNANGLLTVKIGEGTVISGNFSDIDWSDGPYFIKTETDPQGGTDYTISNTSQLLSVPFALHSESADILTGTITESQIIDLQNYLITETDPEFNAWDRSTGIIITENQISDLQEYITDEEDPAVAENFDFTDAGEGDLLRFDGNKWIKFTPEYLIGITNESIGDLLDVEIGELEDQKVLKYDMAEGKWVLADDLGITEETDPAVAENFDFDGAAAGDLLQFNGEKWVRFTPEYLTSYTETQNLADVIEIGNSANSQNITDLADPVNNQDAATKAYVDMLKSQIEAINQISLESGNYAVLMDVDGNNYKTIKIGNQVWMAENLKTTRYTDQTPISTGFDGNEWENYTDGAYFIAPHESIAGLNSEQGVVDAYGLLYNYFTIETGKLCPAGWRVPDENDWKELEVNFLGLNLAAFENLGFRGTNEADLLRSCRQVNSPLGGECDTSVHPRWGSTDDTYGTDDHKFSALPAGRLHFTGVYETTFNLGSFVNFWSSTLDPGEPGSAFRRTIFINEPRIARYSGVKNYGFSVRCIRE